MHEHAVCITGLQRSYPEFSHNVHYSLSNLYFGWRSERSKSQRRRLQLQEVMPPQDRERTRSILGNWRLEDNVGFFGVRPANDSWATVRTDLPPLLGESIQTPCGLGRAPWFSAYAKTAHQRITYAYSFVQMMCDLKACHQLVQAHERKVARDFVTVARLRLDLAWETPLSMPPELRPNTVYSSRMNTKAGLNDKWAIGRRAAMATYLDRVDLIPVANALWNYSAKAISLKATGRGEGLLSYNCAPGSVNIPFTCPPRYWRTTDWQWRWGVVGASAGTSPSASSQRRFTMTSEGFLMWALWRRNVSVAFEPSWIFCKFGNAVNTTARICVPRMRKRTSCQSLICPGGLTDCGCKNTTCQPDPKKSPLWYCESVRGKQLPLDPYSAEEGLY